VSDEGDPVRRRAGRQLDQWLADAHQALVDDFGRLVDVESGLRQIVGAGDGDRTTDG
jgi:hypothetical protein